MIPDISIGMATYDDFDGVYFTIQSLRLQYPNLNIEYIVVDNNPTGPHGETVKNFITNWVKGKYIPYTDKASTSTRNEVFKHATAKHTICMDCHVLVEPNGVTNLLEYFNTDPENGKNLVHGPLWYDDLTANSLSTHFHPEWRAAMYGYWKNDKEALAKGVPFEIPMQGLGLFACQTDQWKGFCEHFKGFGGEEGYIHEKFRLHGGKVICLPNLKWVHRFQRPNGIKYPLSYDDRIWNYFIGWLELYQDPNHPFILDIHKHFTGIVGTEKVNAIYEQAVLKTIEIMNK